MEIKEKIQEFVKSGKENLDLPMIPIRDIEKYLKEISFDDLEMDGEETNGWQVDFWYYFTSKEYGKYCLSGSLHYGDFKLEKQ